MTPDNLSEAGAPISAERLEELRHQAFTVKQIGSDLMRDMIAYVTFDEFCSLLALASAPLSGRNEGLEERARQIIADEERLSAGDEKGNIQLHALRLARVFTAQQILGDKPLKTSPATGDRPLVHDDGSQVVHWEPSSTPPAATGGRDAEYGWVIEHRNSEISRPHYWTGNGWPYDSLDALRFARETDGIRAAAGFDEDDPPPNEKPHRICEHAWDDGRALCSEQLGETK